MTIAEMTDVVNGAKTEILKLRTQKGQLLAALEGIECPECGHILARHADKYGCEYDRGDREGDESGPAYALGPCSCKGGELTEILQAIAAIRAAKE